MFNKHNISEKNGKILKSSVHSKTGGTLIISQTLDKSPVFSNKESVDMFPPQELTK